MNSIIGTWQLVGEVATNELGEAVPPYFGPMPLGIVSFTTAGRMAVVISDGRPAVDARRVYMSYCGSFTFDGSCLSTDVDGASDSFWRQSPQIRYGHVDGDWLVLRPGVGILGTGKIQNEFTWRRLEHPTPSQQPAFPIERRSSKSS